METDIDLKVDSEKYEIRCIGNDNKFHVCLPWENKTKCGIPIVSKKIKPQDYRSRFSCYYCTY